MDLFSELQAVCDRHPATIACFSKGGWLHYGAFWRNIENFARRALAEGVRSDALIVVRCSQPDMRLQVTLALMRLGCRIGISQDLEAYNHHKVEVDFVITDDPKMPPGPKIIRFSQAWLAPTNMGRGGRLPEGREFSLVFGSSGSTGRTKLIEISQHGFIHRIKAKLGEAIPDGHLRYLSVAGDTTSTTLQDIVVCLLRGGTIFRPFERHGLAVLDAIQLHRPTYVAMAPATLVEILKILAETPAQVEKVGLLRLAGSYCSAETQQQALDVIAERIVTSYGATEIGRVATGYYTDTRTVNRSVGRIKDDVEVVTVDDKGQPLPAGTEGELRIRVPGGVAATYPGQSQSQVRTFDGDWFIPGDIGRVDENRNLIVIGRSSNVINVGGTKVSPEAIEEAVAQHANIKDMAVVGIEGPDGFQHVHAAVVSRDPVDLSRLNAYLQQKNTRFGIHELKRVDRIPRTENGKIDRPALKRLFSP